MTSMNTALFRQYTAGELPVLVEFSAPWCVYCRRLEPAMRKLSEQQSGLLLIGQVNIDEEPQLAAQEQIEVVPTLVLYRGGEALGSIVAPESKARIEAFLQETLGT